MVCTLELIEDKAVGIMGSLNCDFSFVGLSFPKQVKGEAADPVRILLAARFMRNISLCSRSRSLSGPLVIAGSADATLLLKGMGKSNCVFLSPNAPSIRVLVISQRRF